jgi:hypothetical protein
MFGGRDILLPRASFELGELRGRLVALGAQFGGLQFDNQLSSFQGISLPDQQFFDSTAIAGRNANFVGFDCARDRIRSGIRLARKDYNPEQKECYCS